MTIAKTRKDILAHFNEETHPEIEGLMKYLMKGRMDKDEQLKKLKEQLDRISGKEGNGVSPLRDLERDELDLFLIEKVGEYSDKHKINAVKTFVEGIMHSGGETTAKLLIAESMLRDLNKAYSAEELSKMFNACMSMGQRVTAPKPLRIKEGSDTQRDGDIRTYSRDGDIISR